MKLEQINALIAKRTGVPVSLLDGKTAEENINKARALIEYRGKSATPTDKNLSPKEQFATWLETAYGDDQSGQDADPAVAALDNLAEELRIASGGYPNLPDGQIDISTLPNSRPTSEIFAEWFYQKTAWDPRKDSEGWIHLT